MAATTSGPAAPRVSPWLQIATLVGLFAGGGFIGWGLSAWAAPGSGLAAGISGLLLPAAFSLGLIAWAGLDLLVAFVVLVRGRRRQPRPDLSPRVASWFVPLSLVIGTTGGLVVGLLPGGQGVVGSLAAYAAAALAYGVTAARLAAAGYLPGPHLE
jgi:hypothetical protein